TLGPALAKPNADELAAWAGRELADEADLVVAARAMQAAGGREVAVSRGADGVLWLAGDAVWAAAAPPVRIVSTVGA
ncbi:PfkB family carbohydrate kinase, partial [Staphylococcus aureus]|uniref:PfkB family carbohydrate kinase n=1 Tax=Staphylococcus aureus TaxID=1280 RepID=UPI0033905D37